MRSIASDEGASRLDAHIYTDVFTVHCYVCDYSRKCIQTGRERADRISSVRSVWLVPDGKPRARLRRHPPFSMLSCCLRCRKHRASREDVTIRTNISGMFRKPLPPKMERTFGKWHGARAHPEISQCHTILSRGNTFAGRAARRCSDTS